MLIELYYSPFCPHCASARRELTPALPANCEVLERNVLEYIDAAVDLGIKQIPALVVNGVLVQQGGLNVAALLKHVGGS